MRSLFAVTCLVFSLAGFAVPGITGADFRERKEAILPDADEGAWTKIPWRTSLWAGGAEAQKKGLPILLFVGERRPLGPGVPGGIAAAAVWSDPTVRQLALLYVAVADDAGFLLDDDGPEGEWFRKILHEAREKEKGGEGVYLVAPSGAFLGAVRPDDPARVAGGLKQGLAAWNALSGTNRLGKPIDPADAAPRPESRLPGDGLAITAWSREASGEWVRDAVWMTREEAEGLVPEDTETGDRREWPEALARRLACFPAFHGQGQGQRITSVVTATAVESGEVVLAIEGRAGKFQLSGHAAYDPEAGRFSAFELLACAPHQPGREKDGAGFYWTLAGKEAIDRLAPSRFGEYDWPEPEDE